MPTDTFADNRSASEIPCSSVTLQLGRADDLRAEVFLTFKLPTAIPIGNKVSLAAMLAGPESIRATTLPVSLPVRKVSERTIDDTLQVTGKVVLTEPAYWTPEVPMLYRVHGELLCDDACIAIIDTVIGIRRLGVRGHSLWLEGRRWVLRGCGGPCLKSNREQQIATARQQGLAVAISLGPDGLGADISTATSLSKCLEEASQHGQPLLIYLDPATTTAIAQASIMALTRHPSVIIVVLPMELLAIAATCKPPAGTLLLAAEVAASEQPTELSPGVDVYLVDLSPGAVPAEEWRRPPNAPAIALRPSSQLNRPDCDKLQVSLANWRLAGDGPSSTWDWAGFFISRQLGE